MQLSEHKSGCGYQALGNGCEMAPFQIALNIAKDEKCAFLKPVLDDMYFNDKLDMVLPCNYWLSTGMIAVWSRKKKIPVIIFKGYSNRQGWVPSYFTNIGPIDPLTTIVYMRIDGSKVDALIPARLEGALKLRYIYNQHWAITPEDVSAVDESVDSELE